LYRWFPMVITLFIMVKCVLVLGVRAHTGFLYSHELIADSKVGLLENGEVACESAGRLREGVFIASTRPFHCRCFVNQGWVFGGEKVEVEQWGRVVDESELNEAFNPWTGSFGDFYNLSATPWSGGKETYLETCKDSSGVERWCWKEPEGPDEVRPLLPKGRDCASYGKTLGQSMSFATISISELFMITSQRTSDTFFTRLSPSGNYWMLLGIAYNIGWFIMNFYLPPLRHLLGLAPLSPHHLAVVIAAALCACISSEVAKIFYVQKMQIDNILLEKEALRRSCGACPEGEL